MNDANRNNGQFWKEFGKLGIAKDRASNIPSEVVMEDGSVNCDPDIVMERWRASFNTLLNQSFQTPGAALDVSQQEDLHSVMNPHRMLTYLMMSSQSGRSQQPLAGLSWEKQQVVMAFPWRCSVIVPLLAFCM